MESDPKHEAELARLRGLGTWMRDVGVVELETRGCCEGDIHIKLGPRPREAPARALSAPERDEQAALANEDKEASAASDEERAWSRKWRRITRSSGAPIPPFPGKAAT